MAEASNRPNSTVYVGGLDTHLVTAATLSEAFIPFGEIADITLPKPEAPSSTDLHRGFGYVEFEDAADAKEAIDNMDQSELYGRVIKVAMAKPDRKDTGEVGLGSTTAIWEQVCCIFLMPVIAVLTLWHRKVIWQSTLRKTGTQWNSQGTRNQKIPCRV
jgi:RNA recognition motif-containing protein